MPSSADGTGAPRLCVIIDTEEEFDWSKPVSPDNRSVRSIAEQHRAQAIFARYGIVPTYVVDHPVAATPEAAATLRAFQDNGTAVIGAHLHPWVNPPYEESLSAHHSYPGNLPADLEYRKLAALTDQIEAAFGTRPTVYKAGRYGLGANTARTLERLAYRVDCSVVPHTAFTDDGGPDFRFFPDRVHALPGSAVMELPLSVGFSGVARRHGPTLYPRLAAPGGMRLRLPGICARSGLLERIRLSPEGADAVDHRRLVRAMARDGHRVFSYTYHSPSLAPGHTPYVRTPADRDRFLDRMDRFFAWFFEEFGGAPATPLEIREQWCSATSADRAA